MTEPYGAKGCSCFIEDYTASHNGHAEERWMPNARCPHHGLLADYLADRRDTGTYRVVPAGADETCRCASWGIGHCPRHTLNPAAETKNWRLRDGRLVADVVEPGTPPTGPAGASPVPMPEPGGDDPDVARAMLPPSAFGLDVPDVGPAECTWGTPYSCRVHCPSTTEEGDRGILAAVRRWIRGRRP